MGKYIFLYFFLTSNIFVVTHNSTEATLNKNDATYRPPKITLLVSKQERVCASEPPIPFLNIALYSET